MIFLISTAQRIMVLNVLSGFIKLRFFCCTCFSILSEPSSFLIRDKKAERRHGCHYAASRKGIKSLINANHNDSLQRPKGPFNRVL